ncbi:1-acyl-sn-glycerol-3-phosphate acyltransferase [mine drainage metagenome]|uniref:1-acyl-sn-glycerol-3-phosphate acyltransferase n=1 Tax=mine drainage metagenome TaxID=410659 RepID=A0A1J5RYA8_9ZZZZ
MKIIKEILARIWALWGLVSFVTTFFIIFIPSMCCYLIPGKKGQEIFITISRIWMFVWLRLVGCPVKVTGKEHFAKNKAYIVTYNHNALLDVPLSAPSIPAANKTIAKSTFTKVPLFGWYYRKGSVIVDRNSDASRRKSFEEMKNVLKQGIHMCIYPEGTRNRTNDPLKKFYSGAFKLAVDTQTQVMPAIIFNTRKAMPIHKAFYLWPHRLRLHFLEPVDATNISADELKDKVFKIMWDYYELNQ